VAIVPEACRYPRKISASAPVRRFVSGLDKRDEARDPHVIEAVKNRHKKFQLAILIFGNEGT